jgi:starch synthase
MEKRRVLYISQEMQPYMATENEISNISRFLPQGIMEQGFEIRNFMPRFGCINERRHQLHEVIRLSGMNLIINDSDQPLIIKVASIPSARMQVYFIDNEEYFQRKATLYDNDGNFFSDNDERAIFYIRGVFETVKKLGWSPDIIHCHGWMASLASVYLKTAYKDDPIFANAKVVMSLYSTDEFQVPLNPDFSRKALCNDMTAKQYQVDKPTYANVVNASLAYADAVVYGSEKVHADVAKFIKEKDCLQNFPLVLQTFLFKDV